MHATLAARRDREGHGRRVAVLALAACLLIPTLAAAAGPGAYVARRFDVQARILGGGTLDVTASITFEFASGTFTKVWREIPSSRTDGVVIADLHYPAGSLITAPPGWRQREITAAALAPRWQMAAAALFVAGLLILFLIRQSYASPGFDVTGQTTTTEPPEALPAALAATLAAKGRRSGFQAVATLVDLADRGVLTIRELPRKLGVRNYELAQVPGRHDLDAHEAEVLTIAFAGAGDEVTMSRARGRLARGGRRFRKAMNGDLAERGLLEPSRKAVRDRLTAVSVVMLLSAGAGAIGVAALIPRYQGWPFLLPLALALCGLIGMVMAAATTSLSDAGLMQGTRWRGFNRHLKTLAEARDATGAAGIKPRWIVYAMALGLARQWSRYLKQHPDAAPAWFLAAGDDPHAAFAAFVGSSAASTSAGSGGGGGAAGGGGSGAA